MNVQVNKLPKSLVELTVELSAEDMKPYLDQAVKEISVQTEVPGFRPGKAPYGILVKKVGEMRIYQLAAEKAVQLTYPQAVTDNKLVIIGQPEIIPEKIAPGNPFIYKAKAALLPKVKLGDYKKIKPKRREIKVEEKDVQETLKNLQKMFGKEKRVRRPVSLGDKVEADLDTYVDNVPIDGGSNKNHPINVGEGHIIPGFEDNLIGMTEGQSKEFKLKFPKEYHKKELAGKPVEFKVKVNGIFELEVPNLDDDFARSAGRFGKLDDLKKQIEKNVLQEKTIKEKQRRELEIVDQLVKKSSFDEIPDILIDSELHKMLHELESQVTGQGMKFDDYLASIKKSIKDLEKEFRPQAERRVKTAIALREIANLEKIEVPDSEITAQVAEDKERYKNNPEVLKQISTDNYKDYINSILRTRKVFALLEKNND